MLEFTLVIIKPDIMNKRKKEREEIIKEILWKYSEAGLDILCLNEDNLTLKQTRYLYLEHKDKPFYDELTTFMRGKVTKVIVYGEDAVNKVREINGPANVLQARKTHPNSIRALYGNPDNAFANAVHASSSRENAVREANFLYYTMKFRQPDNNENHKEKK